MKFREQSQLGWMMLSGLGGQLTGTPYRPELWPAARGRAPLIARNAEEAQALLEAEALFDAQSIRSFEAEHGVEIDLESGGLQYLNPE